MRASVSRVLVPAILICIVGPATIGIAMAAGNTTVLLSPESESVDINETTTVDVIVDTADAGVGAYNITIETEAVAAVQNVTLEGDPSFQQITYDDEQTGVEIRAAITDTANTGTVTIATVTLRGETAGNTPVRLIVTELGDENGDSYNVTGTQDSQLIVNNNGPPSSTPTPTETQSSGGSGGGDDSGSEDTPTPTDTPTETQSSGGSGGDDSGSEDTPTPTDTSQTDESPTPTLTTTSRSETMQTTSTPTPTDAVTDGSTPTASVTDSEDPSQFSTDTTSQPETNSSFPGLGVLTALTGVCLSVLLFRHKTA